MRVASSTLRACFFHDILPFGTKTGRDKYFLLPSAPAERAGRRKFRRRNRGASSRRSQPGSTRPRRITTSLTVSSVGGRPGFPSPPLLLRPDTLQSVGRRRVRTATGAGRRRHRYRPSGCVDDSVPTLVDRRAGTTGANDPAADDVDLTAPHRDRRPHPFPAVCDADGRPTDRPSVSASFARTLLVRRGTFLLARSARCAACRSKLGDVRDVVRMFRILTTRREISDLS
jgi:hypothetical protein